MASLVLPLLSGLAGLFGGGQQQETSGTQSSTGTQNTSSSTTPNLSPIQQSLINQFTSGAENLYNQGTNLQPYTASGLQQIGQTGQAAQQNISNTLAAKGLQNSPAAGNAYTQGAINTGNQQSQFINQIPLLQQQMQQQNIAGLQSAFQVQPTSTSTQGQVASSSNTNQQGTVSGNPTAGLFGGLAAGTGAVLPGLMSSFGSSPSSGVSNVPGGISSVMNSYQPDDFNSMLASYQSPSAPNVGGF